MRRLGRWLLGPLLRWWITQVESLRPTEEVE